MNDIATATFVSALPIGVRGNGKFRFESPRGEEDAGFREETLEGRVRSGAIVGQVRSLFRQDGVECRTGGYQRFGSKNLGKDILRFRARRQ